MVLTKRRVQVADKPNVAPIKLKIETTVEIDATRLKTLKDAYEKAGGQAREVAFANLKRFKTEVYGRIDGELLAYGNIAKRQVDEHFGV